MIEKSLEDIFWVTICAGLVFLMQAGFTCLESGLTRSKNSINVAIKNITDFGISTILYWSFGFALMYGVTCSGWIGTTGFFLATDKGPWPTAFFLFQIMFCATAVTIVSGSTAERLRFRSYIIISILLSSLIYPIFGHWAWNGEQRNMVSGWLAQIGFVDFAGATVVHSVGGWVALAALLVIGPREGRFPPVGPPRKIHGSNLPLSVLGVLLLWMGWFGFNGGSTLALNDQVPGIITNTFLAGASGSMVTLTTGWILRKQADVELVIFGSVAGLVAITASVHVVNTLSAIAIGGIGGMIMLGVDYLLEYLQIDDAVGAIQVHLGAGVWGTLAAAIFGSTELLGTGLPRGDQFLTQCIGIGVCSLWTFGISFPLLLMINRYFPLRVTPEDEYIGLNVSEHGATTELLDMFRTMDSQVRTGDMSLRIPVEPFTEIGQIAERYNWVMDALQKEAAKTANSLKEKELLLREIHHRVKNNMQVMSSLLRLQTRNVTDEKTLEMAKESQNRIKVMALIHEKLYRSQDFANVEFNDYIKDLVNDLFLSYKVSSSDIELTMNIDTISLGIDTAIPCGLIINELVSNSLKYAFPKGKAGEIRISLHRITGLTSDMFELIVSDNGVGISEELDLSNTQSLGLRLITNLAENQLQGKIEIDRKQGTKFQITFKEAKYKQRI
ncbi:MAG: ammonium transporter [Candidatus Scalindua sp.]|nr:ammonium transporter [Candidatus Scalindua sp.]